MTTSSSSNGAGSIFSKSNFYERRAEQREHNIFTEEYYSGTDITIYIDDVEVDFISSIGFSLQEQQKPIYGYASRTYDDISVGSRIVVGSFRVPVQNPGNNQLSAYLQSNIELVKVPYNEDIKEEGEKAPYWVVNSKGGR